MVELLGRPVAIVVAGRDERLRPSIVRAWGPLLDAERGELELGLSSTPEARAVSALRAHGDVAVNVVSPTTYHSIQVKGQAISVGEPTPEQLERAAAHLAVFTDEVEQVGIPRAFAPRFMGAIGAAVRIELREFFDQTPGPGAGRAL